MEEKEKGIGEEIKKGGKNITRENEKGKDKEEKRRKNQKFTAVRKENEGK